MSEFVLFCIGVLALAAAVFILVMAYSTFKETRREEEARKNWNECIEALRSTECAIEGQTTLFDEV